MIKAPFFLILLILFPLPAFAQRIPSRWVQFNPMADRLLQLNDQPLLWLNKFSGWAAFGKYIADNENEHAWFQNLGGYLELVRFGQSSNLVFLSHIEFISNDKNDIRFNPRAIFWEEGFLYTRAYQHSFFQLGYFHRCKHDIDNYLSEQERTLIFGSLQCNYIYNINTQPKFGNLRFVLKNDIYTICRDYRLPRHYERSENSYEQMITSANFHIDYRRKHLNNWLHLFGQFYIKGTLFGKYHGFLKRFENINKPYFDYGFSVGALLGKREILRLGFFFERMADTGIRVVPQKTNLMGLSLTAVNPSDVW